MALQVDTRCGRPEAEAWPSLAADPDDVVRVCLLLAAKGVAETGR